MLQCAIGLLLLRKYKYKRFTMQERLLPLVNLASFGLLYDASVHFCLSFPFSAFQPHCKRSFRPKQLHDGFQLWYRCSSIKQLICKLVLRITVLQCTLLRSSLCMKNLLSWCLYSACCLLTIRLDTVQLKFGFSETYNSAVRKSNKITVCYTFCD